MSLQRDRAQGLLSEEQYKTALKQIKWSGDVMNEKQNETVTNNHKQSSYQRKRIVKKEPLSKQQRKRRSKMRKIMKWMFDVELIRKQTPLYAQSGTDSESIIYERFLPICQKCLQYIQHEPEIANVKSKSMLQNEMLEMVVNRRRNLLGSRKQPKKPGAKKKAPLKLIYESLREYLVFKPDGGFISLTRPTPLPLVTGASRPKEKSPPPTVNSKPHTVDIGSPKRNTHVDKAKSPSFIPPPIVVDKPCPDTTTAPEKCDVSSSDSDAGEDLFETLDRIKTPQRDGRG